MTHIMWEKSMKPVHVRKGGEEEEVVPDGVLEIYTDGSGGKTGKGSAGWGFVVVNDGAEQTAGF